MSLYAATLALAAFLLLLGGLLLWNGTAVKTNAMRFLRSDQAAWITFGGSGIWFLWTILHLSEADFGTYKLWLFLFFGALVITSFFHVKDFLSVRGLAALTLLSSYELLEVAYFQEPQSRLFFVSFIYLCVILALFLGSLPFLLRNFFEWLFHTKTRPRGLGIILGGYGALLAFVALNTY